MKLPGFLSFMYSLIRVKFVTFRRKLCKNIKRLLIGYLPKIIKKQTLLVTLYLKGRNEKIFDDINMSELNKHLTLANDPKVLDYLVALNEKCDLYHFDFKLLLDKHNCTLDAKIKGDVVTNISMDIIESIPACLRYSKAEMLQDIGGLLFRLPLNHLYTCRS